MPQRTNNAGLTLAHPRVASLLFGTPLMVEPDRGAAMVQAFLARSASLEPGQIHFNGAEPQAALYGTSRGGDQRYSRIDNIAVISVFGALTNKISWLDEICGMTSYELIGAAISDALEDTRIDGILLELDTPGGEVSGVFDLAESIAEACAIKPVWATVNDMACSAGYLIAAACDRIYVPQNGCVGSVGAVAMHMDVSEAYKSDGVNVTIVEAGARKAWMTPYRPLDEEAKTWLQERLDSVRTSFVDHVAEWRDLDPATVLGTEAGVYYGQEGVDIGFATGILTFDNALDTFVEYLANPEESDMALFGSRSASRVGLTTAAATTALATAITAAAAATQAAAQPTPAATAPASTPAAATAPAAPVASAPTPPAAVEAAVTAAVAPQAADVNALVQVALDVAVQAHGLTAAAAQLTRIGAVASIAEALNTGLSVEAFRQQVVAKFAAEAEATAPSTLPDPGLAASNAPKVEGPTIKTIYNTREAARRARLAAR